MAGRSRPSRSRSRAAGRHRCSRRCGSTRFSFWLPCPPGRRRASSPASSRAGNGSSRSRRSSATATANSRSPPPSCGRSSRSPRARRGLPSASPRGPGPARAARPVRRVELQWGVVLHAMPTQPLPPARYTNAYLIGEPELALVDPGSGNPEPLRELFALTDHLAAEGRRVTMIVVTHHHPDHTGGVAACRERLGARVVGHRDLAPHVPLDVVVKDGDWLPLAPGLNDWTLRVLETPGHTRDSISLWHEKRRTLFCGDLLAGGAGSVVIDPPDGNMRDYLGSLERCAALGAETLFPAHGSPSGAAERHIRALIAHRMEREAKVVAALGGTARTLEQLLPGGYAAPPRELWTWARRSLLAHLEKLERDGRAMRAGDAWRAIAD